MNKILKAIFPMFDDNIFKDNKKFIISVFFISSIVTVFYSFKIANVLKPILYDKQTITHSGLFFTSLMIIIPSFIFIFTNLSLFFTLNIILTFPIFINIPKLNPPLKFRNTFNNYYTKYNSLKKIIVMRC